MNNNIFKELYFKVFQSGNPMFFYIGINVIVFVLLLLFSVLFKSVDLISFIGVPASLSILPSRIYTVFTYMFFNFGFLNFLFNMLWLYWFGNIFMNFLNRKQFHFVYLAGGMITAVFYVACTALFPVLGLNFGGGYLIGSSAAVLAIIIATATLVPNYAVQLLIFGEVKIKYIALVYIAFDVISVLTSGSANALVHLSAALFGFVFIKQLQNGKDWSKIFERKHKLKVVKNNRPVNNNPTNGIPQSEIDAILDKISKSGYDKLSASEKEKLFKASKN